MRSVHPRCSQGTPIPSLYLSSVSMGVVLLASGHYEVKRGEQSGTTDGTRNTARFPLLTP